MWKTVKLGDLFKIGSSKRVLKAEWKDSGVPFYRGREITELSKTGSVDNDLFISEEHFSALKSQHGVPQEGDLVVTAIGTIGNTYIVRENDRFYFKDASVLWLNKVSDVDSRFVDYWFKSSSFFEQLRVGNGATVDTLPISKLNIMDFPLPPLAEQKRIVAKLDAAFAEIDEAALEIKKAIHQARLVSQKIIDDNLESQLPDANKIQLKNFCNIKHGYAFDGKSFSPSDDESKPIVLTPGNFAEDGTTKFTQKNTKRLHENFDDSLLFSKNSLVVVMTDLSSKMLLLGKPGFIKKTNVLHNQRIGLVQNNEQTILNKYLYFYFKSTKYLSEIKRTASGTMVRHTAPKRILDNYINAPKSLTSQRKVSDRISKSLFYNATLISVYEDKTSNLFALKSALLAHELQSEAA